MTPEEWKVIDIDNAWRSARALRRDVRQAKTWLEVLYCERPVPGDGLVTLAENVGGSVLARIEIEFHLGRIEVHVRHILRKIRRFHA